MVDTIKENKSMKEMILARVERIIPPSIENLILNQCEKENVEKRKNGYKEYINSYYKEKRSINSTVKRDKLKITQYQAPGSFAY